MSNDTKIEPALSAEEWAWANRLLADERNDAFRTAEHVNDEPLGMMAIGNHALPDDSPYKIGRGDVQILRFIADRIDDTHITAGKSPLRTIADKLEALLPPPE